MKAIEVSFFDEFPHRIQKVYSFQWSGTGYWQIIRFMTVFQAFVVADRMFLYTKWSKSPSCKAALEFNYISVSLECVYM